MSSLFPQAPERGETSSPRRRMLGLAGWALALPLFGVPRWTKAAASAQVSRAMLPADASTDCTALLQRAVDQLPAEGGEVVVGPGEYLIDVTRSLKLKSHVSFRLQPGAVLKAKPNSSGSYALIRIQNATDVQIHGGSLLGERGSHTGSAGEWGMGVDVRNSHGVLIEGTHISDCWGDGIYVGSSTSDDGGACSDVTLRNVVAEGNRRQGVSIVACHGGLIERCTFRKTSGTAPAAGIDLEPNAGMSVRDVRIVDCTAEENDGDGFQMYAGAAGATIENCHVEGGKTRANKRYGVSLAGAHHCHVTATEITDNGNFGVYVFKSASECVVAPSSLTRNLRQQIAMVAAIKKAAGGSTDQVMVEDGASGIHVQRPNEH